MDAPSVVFWMLLFGGLPGTLTLWTHRSESVQRRIFIPISILVLIGLGLTATSSTGEQVGGIAEIGLYVAGIVGILCIGLYLMVFGGITPVGPVPRGWRTTGGLLVISAVILGGILTIEPEWSPLTAPKGWSSYAASGIVGLITASLFGAVIVWLYGYKRWMTLIGLILTTSLGLIGAILLIESNILNKSDVSESLTTAIGSAFGLILAAIFAIGLMVQIESKAAVPITSHPLNKEEVERMEELIQANVRGEQE